MKSNYVIRRMVKEELKIACDWACEEGWNPGLHDWESFYEADPNGFFIGLLNGEPIATGSAINYDAHFAFCGLYIVKREFRQKGFGMRLTEERLKYVGSRITGIDGVLENVSKYQRIGYVPAHKSTRYELANPPSFASNQKVVKLNEIPFKLLCDFDQRYFPAPRSRFLHQWITQPNSFALGYLENGDLHGYGVMRPCIKGYRIGPLFAKSILIAEILFQSLCSKVNEGPFYLDVPEPNNNGTELIKNFQMTPTFEVMRMYRNGTPIVNLQGVYGITTFELG